MADSNSILDRLPASGKMPEYKGTTLILSGISAKGGGDFALVEAHAIQVTNEDDRLDAVLVEIKKRLDSGSGGSGSGESGATFYPAVSEDGVISWTNDKGLENPTPVNIKGAGIDHIELVYSDDEYSEYRIYFTDNSYFDYDVKNGTPGKDGTDGTDGADGRGVEDVVLVQEGDISSEYALLDGSGETIGTFLVKKGVGISSIEKDAGDSSAQDYKINFTDGSDFIFTVYNGSPGTNGVDGTDGTDGRSVEDVILVQEGDISSEYALLDGSGETIGTFLVKKGVGISSIEKDAGDSSAQDYKINFTDGSDFIFTVYNGTPGKDGADGKDGTDGKDGKDGNGIDYIQEIGGVMDGYTTLDFNMTDGPTQTVHIPNGKDGKDGADGVDGTDGEDGKTPFVKDGYWYIGDQNTGIKARGDTGNGINYIQTVDAVGGYTVLEIYMTNGTSETVYIPNGKDGEDGKDGNGIDYIQEIGGVMDGYTTLDIYMTDGPTQTVHIPNGKNGKDGQDAVSPSVSVDKVGKTTTITITDKDGVHTATIKDGMDGSGEGKVLERAELQRPYVYTECKFLSIAQEYPLFPVYRKSDAVFNDARYKARIPLFCRWYQNNSFSLDLDSPSGYVGALTISKYSGSIEIEYDYTTLVYSGGGSDISFCFDDNNDLLLLIMGADNNVISEISMRDVFGSRYSYLIQYYIKNSSPSTEFADIYRIFNTDGTSIPMNIIPPIM